MKLVAKLDKRLAFNLYESRNLIHTVYEICEVIDFVNEMYFGSLLGMAVIYPSVSLCSLMNKCVRVSIVVKKDWNKKEVYKLSSQL